MANTIPRTFENSSDLPKPAPEKPQQSVETKPTDPNQNLPQASQFIQSANWVLINESQKIGTACNHFVMRVLQVSGFFFANFMANDFDLYAKKYFSTYKAVDFKIDKTGSEITRLKLHLMSYPERTPFIMQWSRSGVHGHIAIVERIQEQLIIYQANLNKSTAQKDQTTVQTLLSGFNRRKLTVYSDFKK